VGGPPNPPLFGFLGAGYGKNGDYAISGSGSTQQGPYTAIVIVPQTQTQAAIFANAEFSSQPSNPQDALTDVLNRMATRPMDMIVRWTVTAVAAAATRFRRVAGARPVASVCALSLCPVRSVLRGGRRARPL
jgi:hypothetical protein